MSEYDPQRITDEEAKELEIQRKMLQGSYQAIFKKVSGETTKDLHEAAKDVIVDLANYCYKGSTPFSSDPIEMARRVGRGEVFDKIIRLLEVDHKDLYGLNDYEG